MLLIENSAVDRECSVTPPPCLCADPTCVYQLMICAASKGPWMSLRGSSYSQHLGRVALGPEGPDTVLPKPGAGPCVWGRAGARGRVLCQVLHKLWYVGVLCGSDTTCVVLNEGMGAWMCPCPHHPGWLAPTTHPSQGPSYDAGNPSRCTNTFTRPSPLLQLLTCAAPW